MPRPPPLQASPATKGRRWARWAAALRDWGSGSLLEGLLWAVVLGMALGAVAVLGYVAGPRLVYPFELEWMEGGVLDHVRTVLAGEPLYRRPSLDFTPYLYTPLYYYACAALGLVFGPSFALARAVSCLSAIACLALLYSFVRRETGDRLGGIIAAGLFAATYELSGFWLDIARPDSLALALLLGGLWLARFGKSGRHAALAGLLLFCAFATKQTMLALALPALAYAWLCSRRQGAILTATYAVLVLGYVLLADRLTDGWFSYYVFWVPAQHELLWPLWRRLAGEFVGRASVMVLWAFLALSTPAIYRLGRSRWVFYLLWIAVAMGSSYLGILHRDGYINVFMPGYASLAVATGLGAAWLRRASRDRRGLPAVGYLAALGLVLQLRLLQYDPLHALPTRDDVRAGQQMLAMLRTAPAELWIPSTGFYGFRAGHAPVHAHTMAIADIFKAGPPELVRSLRDEMVAAVRQHRFGSIVVGRGDSMLAPAVRHAIRQEYRFKQPLFIPLDRHRTWPKRGFVVRPEAIWVPRTP